MGRVSSTYRRGGEEEEYVQDLVGISRIKKIARETYT
jgi:hypothetical protein